MKQKFTLLVALLFVSFLGQAQTQFWSDTFEGAPSSGTRTPEENGGTTPLPSVSYFKLTDGSTISQVVPFTGKQGTNFWGGEDHNAAGTGFTASGAQGATPASNPLNELQIDWTGINIAGKAGLSFKGLIAAASTNEPWDNINACVSGLGTTNTDYIIVEYSIDGGAYINLIRFYNRGSASNGVDKYLFEDTDNNGCGDGTQLTNAFGEFTKTIAGTGTTMSLRIRVFSEGNNEEWGIDNFRLYETPLCVAPVVTSNPPNRTICSGGNTTFGVVATGATAYQWQVNTGSGFTNLTNGAPYSNVTTNIMTITGATSGMSGYLYRCVISNGVASCFTNSNSGTLTVSTPILTPLSQTNVSCNGGSNGSATVSASGGIPSYTYSWAPSGGTGATASGLTAGNYTCTVTDGIACSTTQTFTITQPTAIVVTAASQTNVACFGGSNGAATINTPTGGAGGYTYNWTPGNPTGDGTISVTGLTAGSWTCTVTDANSCTATRTFTVTQPPAISVTAASQTNVSCNGGSNGSATINTPTGGAGGYTYNWTPGNPTGDGTVSVTGLSAGTWTCTVTDANSCTATTTFNVTQPPALSVTASSQTNVACFGGATGAATINTPTGGSGGYTYNWTPGNPTGDGTISVTGLTAGSWTCTVTDANSCTATTTFNVTQPPALSVTAAIQTNVACFGGATGAATINTPTGGAGGYTYNWTPGNPTGDGTVSVTGLSAGTWTCTVTDANSCTATTTFNVTQPPVISVTAASQTNVSCFGGSNGAASINTPTGGAGGYTYNWTPGNPTGDGTVSVTGLTAGSWTCTTTDANGCTATRTFTVTQPTAIVVTAASQTNVSCFGGSNGAASINTPTGGAGGYTYNWTPGNPTGDGTVSVTGLSAQTYTCTVTDANGCTATQTFTITQPPVISVTPSSQTNVSCFGGSNGAASINTPTGGAGGYTYNWTPGTPTGDGTVSVTGLTAGSWTCTTTDANGCTATRTFTVTQPPAISVTAASQTNVSCNGGSNGSATINTPTGGAGGYTYDWTPGTPTGDGTVSITGLTAGSWTCTTTDANGCSATQIFTITQPAALDNTVSQALGVLTANLNGAAYQWYTCPNTLLTGETNQSYTPSVVGDYKVDVTLAGCTVTSSCVTVSVLGNPSFELFSKFKLYPNPNGGRLNVDSEIDGNVLIVNQLGQIVKTFSVKANVINTINIDELTDGTYFVKGTNGMNISTHKLIIKK